MPSNVNNFMGVMDDKLHKLKKQLAKQLDKPKNERNIKYVKTLIKEAKTLRAILKEAQDEGHQVTCPHCKKKFNIDLSSK